MADRTSNFFKGVSIQTVITLVMGVMEMVVFAVISRLLTKEEFGYYAAILGIIAVVMSISEAGLGSSIIQKKNATQAFMSTAFTWSFLIGIVASLFVFVFAPIIAEIVADQTLTMPLRLMSVTVLTHSIISVGNGVLYRKLAFKTAGLIGVISYFIASIISIVMASRGMGLMAVVALPIVNSVIQVLLLFYKVKYPRFSIRKQETKEIVSFSGWLTMGVIFNNLTHQLDKLLLPKWMSIEMLGAYNRPAGFVSTISTKINSIFDTVLFPMLSELQDDKNKVKDIFHLSTSLLNSFSIILAAVFFFNAHLIVLVFFGSEWIDIVPILRIISISVIFNINGRLVDCFFRSLAYVKLGFFLRVLSAAVMFACIYVGSLYGIRAVALSIVVANITNILIKICCLAIKIHAPIFSILCAMLVAWRPVVPLLLIGIPFLLVGNHSWGVDMCFAFIFAVIVVVEFVFFPNWIGLAYKHRVYPMVERILDKYKK